MKIIDLQRSVFFNKEFREALDEFATSRSIDKLSSNDPKEVMEAAERLSAKVKNAELKKELEVVAAVAGQRKKLAEITKKKSEIENKWNRDKIAKHRDEVESVYRNQPLATAELNRLESQRSMGNEELKERLREGLG